MSESAVQERWDFITVQEEYRAVWPLSALAVASMSAVVGATWALPAYVYLAVTGAMLALIDARTKRLPNAIVLPAYPIFAGLLLLPALIDGAWGAYLGALLGGVAGFGIYLILALVNPRGIGMGDVKLAGVLGMALGWFGMHPWLVGITLGFILFAVAGVVLMMMGRASRNTALPFGPAMLIGAWVGIIIGAL